MCMLVINIDAVTPTAPKDPGTTVCEQEHGSRQFWQYFNFGLISKMIKWQFE